MGATSRETIVIEPKSRIASFETLGYHTTRAANGAIAGALFGKDKEKSLEFFKSRTSRKNKEFLSLLTSEIYSYLNSVMPDTADPADYFFRIWLRLEIERKTGEIVTKTKSKTGEEGGRPMFIAKLKDELSWFLSEEFRYLWKK
jgi:hypothetical protein